ncbi:MAG: hypothetical protein ACM3SW_13650 [Actinomycetota bacterium]
MKLIQILALATLMAVAAAAQNAAPTAVHAAQARPSPTPKAAHKAGAKVSHAHPRTGHPVHRSRKGAVRKTGSVTAEAKGNVPKPVTKKMSATGGRTGTAGRPVVKAGTLPPQKKVKSHESTMLARHSAAKGIRPAAAARKSPRPVVSAPVKTRPAAKAKAAKTSKAPVRASRKSAVMSRVPEPKARITAAGPSTAEKKPARRLIGSAGRRDPFVSPIRSTGSITPTPNCTSGKRCLSIPELILQGTVRDISGRMMAVVSTSNRRTYTLRENDQVFNGSVEKITSDSIIFREYVKDALGRESAREVVKKMGPAS